MPYSPGITNQSGAILANAINSGMQNLSDGLDTLNKAKAENDYLSQLGEQYYAKGLLSPEDHAKFLQSSASAKRGVVTGIQSDIAQKQQQTENDLAQQRINQGWAAQDMDPAYRKAMIDELAARAAYYKLGASRKAEPTFTPRLVALKDPVTGEVLGNAMTSSPNSAIPWRDMLGGDSTKPRTTTGAPAKPMPAAAQGAIDNYQNAAAAFMADPARAKYGSDANGTPFWLLPGATITKDKTGQMNVTAPGIGTKPIGLMKDANGNLIAGSQDDAGYYLQALEAAKQAKAAQIRNNLPESTMIPAGVAPAAPAVAPTATPVAAPKVQFVPGVKYKDAGGNVMTYNADGTWSQ